MKNGPSCPFPEHSEAESPGVVFLGFKKRISIKTLHFTSESLLRTYCVLWIIFASVFIENLLWFVWETLKKGREVWLK